LQKRILLAEKALRLFTWEFAKSLYWLKPVAGFESHHDSGILMNADILRAAPVKIGSL
jgi:hypothetical protein